MGAKSAEDDRPMVERELEGAHLVIICAGMGGGTGGGAAPIGAPIAKEQGAIVVAMVTYPFALERARRKKADECIAKLRANCDSVIILDNNRLVHLVPNLPMSEAFAVPDEILARAISGLVWTITQPSLINIDFADVRAIMQGGGVGFIAVGEGKGTDKVTSAADAVIKNDESGLPMVLIPQLVVHNVSDRWIVAQLLKSTQLPGGNQNDVNQLAPDGLRPHLSHYLTDADAWFVLGDKHDVNYFDRRAITFTNTDDFETGGCEVQADSA